MRAEEGWKTGSVLLEALTTNFSIFCCDNSLSADTKMMMMMHDDDDDACKRKNMV